MIKMFRMRKKFKEAQEQADALAPKVGQMAPDFELRDVAGANPTRLSSFRGKKPVALLFGSFT